MFPSSRRFWWFWWNNLLLAGTAPRPTFVLCVYAHCENYLDELRLLVAFEQMLAIMGPSGAGKTSLLNCLSLRNKSFK